MTETIDTDNVKTDTTANNIQIKQKRDEKIFTVAISFALLFLIFSWVWVFKFGVPLVHSLHSK